MNAAILDIANLSERAISSGSQLDYQLSGIPWEPDRFRLGAGIDAVTGEVAKQAVEDFSVESAPTRDVEFKYHMVRSKSEMESVIDVATKGKYNIKMVSVGQSTSFLQEVTYSETRHSLVARLIAGSAQPLTPAAGYRMKADAAALMKTDPARFRETYGDYFISGQSRRAELVVVYQFASMDASSLRDFTAGLEVSVEGLFSQEGSTRLKHKASNSSVSVSVSVHMLGVPSQALKHAPSMLEVTDLAAALTWFADHAEGRPEAAQLTHYRYFDDTLPMAVAVPSAVFASLKVLYDRLWLLRSRFHGAPEIYRRDLQPRFVKLDALITARKSELAGSPADIEDLTDQVGQLLYELQLISDRKDFHARLRIAREAEKGRVAGGGSAKRQHSWMYGVSSELHSEAVKIHSESKRFAEKFRHPLGSKRKGTLAFGDGSRRLVVGMLIHSNWTDGTGGSWKTGQDHFVLEPQASVQIESEGSRGCDWTVTSYYVDADLYRFE